jgi:hypothetical protein
LEGIKGLEGVKQLLDAAAEENLETTDEKVKQNVTLRIMGMMEGLLEAVEAPLNGNGKIITPGAAGFWARGRVNVALAGALEGSVVILAAAPLIALVLLALPQGTPKMIQFLLASALVGGAGEIVNRWVHSHFGVYVPGFLRPVFNRAVIAAGQRTARLTLLGIPFVAAALLYPNASIYLAAIGFLVAVLPHTVRNAMWRAPLTNNMLTPSEEKLLAVIQELRKNRDNVGYAKALSELVPF